MSLKAIVAVSGSGEEVPDSLSLRKFVRRIFCLPEETALQRLSLMKMDLTFKRKHLQHLINSPC